MSRFNDYNNIYDSEDDGEDIEITEEQVEASDDQGREEAATLIETGKSIQGDGKYAEQQRRMFFRWAQKALADGAGRREEAAAAARALGEAVEREARARAEQEAKERRRRERFERSMRESDERWARLNEETARLDAEWKAGGAPERERAAREAAARRARTPSAATSTHRSTARAVERAQAPRRQPRAINPAMPTVSPLAAPKPGVGAAPTPRSGARTGSLQPPSQLLPRSPADPRPAAQPVRTVTAPNPATVTATRPPALRLPTTPSSERPASAQTRPPNPTARVGPPPRRAEQDAIPLTGADLVRWRTAAGITQGAAAELLGVAPSTVAKAELLPMKALGEALAVALRGRLAS
jgi:hypothetical protein